MSNFLSKIFAFSREEKRISSSEFEAAVNAALLSDTVADACIVESFVLGDAAFGRPLLCHDTSGEIRYGCQEKQQT